ncbi:MAG: hypothetical protein PVF16_01815 [Chromatiales bacterium]
MASDERSTNAAYRYPELCAISVPSTFWGVTCQRFIHSTRSALFQSGAEKTDDRSQDRQLAEQFDVRACFCVSRDHHRIGIGLSSQIS